MTALLVAAAFIGVLVIAELVSRAVATVAEEDHWLRDGVLQCKDDQMKWHARHNPPEVVFIGSSSIMCAVDPLTLLSDFGIRSYNAGISRGTMSFVAAWARDFVLMRLRPRILIIECWVGTLNDSSWLIKDWETYRNAPIFTSRARWRWFYELGHRVVLLRVITKLHSPSYLNQAARKMIKRKVFLRLGRPLLREDLIGVTGEATEYDDRLTNFTGPRMEKTLRGILHDFSVGGSEWQALESLARDELQRGTRVFLLRTPTTEEHKSFFEGGVPGWTEAESHVSALAATIDIPYLVPEADLDASRDFADATHTNGIGKQRFTRALGRELLALGVMRPSESTSRTGKL